MTETYRQCLGCKLHHKPSMACSTARRLHASGLLPQPTDEIRTNLAVIAEADRPENGGPLTIRKPVEYASVNTIKAPNTTNQGVNKDRHSKDYMKAYMAKYRADNKAKTK